MIVIDAELVSKLIKDQFPEWSKLPVTAVSKNGHDNRIFHLGSDMTVRLPVDEAHAPQVEKEILWLPKLKPHISLTIHSPLAKGKPSKDYPWYWSINKWIRGETVNHNNISNIKKFASDLANFLKELHAINTFGGPLSGKHNFYRGASLIVYDQETKKALKNLETLVNSEKLIKIWNKALESQWTKKTVWVHGDITPDNLLVNSGELSGVIDFGIPGIGEPACDLAMYWTFFDNKSRISFSDTIKLDKDTWNRARGWALWKALISYSRSQKKLKNCIRIKTYN